MAQLSCIDSSCPLTQSTFWEWLAIYFPGGISKIQVVKRQLHQVPPLCRLPCGCLSLECLGGFAIGCKGDESVTRRNTSELMLFTKGRKINTIFSWIFFDESLTNNNISFLAKTAREHVRFVKPFFSKHVPRCSTNIQTIQNRNPTCFENLGCMMLTICL